MDAAFAQLSSKAHGEVLVTYLWWTNSMNNKCHVLGVEKVVVA